MSRIVTVILIYHRHKPRDLINVKYLGKFYNNKNKLLGFIPRANYTDRATAACRRGFCQLLQIKSVAWSTQRIPTAVFSAS
jgi:hypothetical protein